MQRFVDVGIYNLQVIFSNGNINFIIVLFVQLFLKYYLYLAFYLSTIVYI